MSEKAGCNPLLLFSAGRFFISFAGHYKGHDAATRNGDKAITQETCDGPTVVSGWIKHRLSSLNDQLTRTEKRCLARLR